MSLTRFVRSLLRILAAKPQLPPSLQDNALLRAILERRTVRRFTAQPIPDDVMAAILEAARVAPSTVNLQTWSLALFDAESWRETFGTPMPWAGQRAVVVMGDTHRARGLGLSFPQSPLVEYTVAVMNASLAAMNMTVAAEALGLGSVMNSETGRTGLMDAAHLQQALALPQGVYPLTTIVFGYPAGRRPPMPPKLPLDQICFQGRYREADPAIMAEWLAQMQAGFKASRPGSSFDGQLRHYAGKIERAEADLRRMVLGDNNASSGE
ncbi:MAG: nitroreductase family protein [Anaerolineae bacterium]|nr:nitroreductase family protein [Anaerolineae bacterium]